MMPCSQPSLIAIAAVFSICWSPLPGMTVKAVASHFSVSRVQVIKHLATLEAAGLVISEKVGRTRQLYFNPIPAPADL